MLDLPKRDETPILPGVRAAKQSRSIRIRDAYLQAGIKLLNEVRFNDLKVSSLAEHCGYSVGSFYTRFDDKDAFFRALRFAVITSCDEIIDARVSPQHLERMTPEEASDELVDLLADIFSGPYRGVLRESLLRILEPDDPWAPMRDSARRIIRYYHQSLSNRLPQSDKVEARAQLSFAFQIVVGVLQNDLVNDYHIYSTRDRSIRTALKDNLRKQLSLRPA